MISINLTNIFAWPKAKQMYVWVLVFKHDPATLWDQLCTMDAFKFDDSDRVKDNTYGVLW